MCARVQEDMLSSFCERIRGNVARTFWRPFCSLEFELGGKKGVACKVTEHPKEMLSMKHNSFSYFVRNKCFNFYLVFLLALKE